MRLVPEDLVGLVPLEERMPWENQVLFPVRLVPAASAASVQVVWMEMHSELAVSELAVSELAVSVQADRVAVRWAAPV